ncbi:hypothetical protein CBS9595_000528 [Malassezia furfur]|nr:hypothetical protein CBS9595_000528 [Malassezia furfur]
MPASDATPALDEALDAAPGAASDPPSAPEETQGQKRAASSPSSETPASETPSKRAKAAVSLSTWLTSSGASADPEGLPEPYTCPAARLEDRNSVFVGYVYPLSTASPTRIQALLDNLTHVVHPAIPQSQLPPQFQHASAKHRRSTHDMYAYRVLQLKPGRTGLQGPNDFGIEQGLEDDGEHWGAEKVMRVIRELGASDVLVVVSRWYGGELLGPVRFDHITNVARAALLHFLAHEAVQTLRTQLQQLDREIAQVRHPDQPPPPPDAYDDLTEARAKRLLQARTKTLAMLRRKAS